MMMALFDQEVQDKLWENEIMAENAKIIAETAARNLAQGKEEGIGIGSFYTLASLVKDGIVSKEYAAGKLGITVEEFDKRYKAFCVTSC